MRFIIMLLSLEYFSIRPEITDIHVTICCTYSCTSIYFDFNRFATNSAQSYENIFFFNFHMGFLMFFPTYYLIDFVNVIKIN